MDATQPRTQRRTAKLGAAAFAGLALVCAAIAALLVVRIVQAKGFEQEKKVPVVVAVRAIEAAQPIAREDLKLLQWPESLVPAGAVADPETLFKNGKPAVAATGILAGEPIVRARLASATQGTAMAALVQEGYRAVAVKVDDAITRAGLLYPGARVDVVATLRNSTSFTSTTRVAVDDVRILSVEEKTDVENYRKPRDGKDGEKEGAGASKPHDAVVTIEVTPEQMELVLLAQREGKVDLALRNASDEERVRTPGATPASLLAARGADPHGPAQAPAREERSRPTEGKRSARAIRLAPPVTSSQPATLRPIETYVAR